MNKFNLIMFILVASLLLVSSVSALGVTPARTTLNFQPGLQQTVDFTLVNSENKDMNIQVYVEGELKDYVGLIGDNYFKMKSSEGSRAMKYQISLPLELSPGLHKSEVIILNLPKEDSGEKTHVGAALAVATQIYVHVPYPGKYIEAELKVDGDEKNKRFIIAMVSRGDETINQVSAEVHIYDSESSEIKVLNTNEISLGPSEQKEIIANWDVDAVRGRYVVKAILNSDGEQKLLEKNFEIGSLLLDLKQIFVEDFVLGGIAKFNMVVENKWIETIENTYAEMRIYDDDFNEIDSLESASYNIPADTQTVMNYYWDTADISEDMYNANVILYYSDKKTQQDLKLDVKPESINVLGLGYVISSQDSEGSSGNNLVVIMGIVIGVLVLLNLLWFVILRKKFAK